MEHQRYTVSMGIIKKWWCSLFHSRKYDKVVFLEDREIGETHIYHECQVCKTLYFKDII